jgi:hypothetical protein
MLLLLRGSSINAVSFAELEFSIACSAVGWKLSLPLPLPLGLRPVEKVTFCYEKVFAVPSSEKGEVEQTEILPSTDNPLCLSSAGGNN